MQGQQEGCELFCTFGKCKNLALFGTYCRYHQAERAASAEDKLELMRDGISDMKAAMQSEIDAERLRGDTYRRRALALQLRAQSQRGTIKILQSMLKDTILERNALNKQVNRRDHWIDEALNSGNGTYQP